MTKPACPNCGHPIPEELLRKAGAAAMGRAATGKAKARTSEQAIKAARASAAVRTAKAQARKAGTE